MASPLAGSNHTSHPWSVRVRVAQVSDSRKAYAVTPASMPVTAASASSRVRRATWPPYSQWREFNMTPLP